MDTRTAIKRQFMKQYSVRDFSLISVKGLCQAIPAARSTFYAYFDNTDEVRCEIEDELIDDLKQIRTAENARTDFSVYMDEVEALIRNNWDDLYAFLVLQPDARFIRKWKDAIRDSFALRYPEKRDSHNFNAVTEIMASALISAYTYWLENPEGGSVEEVKAILHRVLDSLAESL